MEATVPVFESVRAMLASMLASPGASPASHSSIRVSASAERTRSKIESASARNGTSENSTRYEIAAASCVPRCRKKAGTAVMVAATSRLRPRTRCSSEADRPGPTSTSLTASVGRGAFA